MRDASEIRQRLQGPVCSVPTVFTKDGGIDHAGIRSAVDVALGGGCDVIMVTWGDSLLSLLTDDEVGEIHRTIAGHVRGRAITIACDNMWWTGKSVQFARHCKELGYDLYMPRPPEWSPGAPETLADHYRAIARVMPLCLVGKVPLRTCELIYADQTDVLAFKDDWDLLYAMEVCKRFGDRWSVIGGGGMKRHYILWPHGARSWLDVFIRHTPAPAVEYWRALQRGDVNAAWQVVMRYEDPVWTRAFGARYGFDGFEHATLEAFGVAGRWRRDPTPNATDAELEEVRVFYRDLGLL